MEVSSYEHEHIHGVSSVNGASDDWRVLRTIIAERYCHHRRLVTGNETASRSALRRQRAGVR